MPTVTSILLRTLLLCLKRYHYRLLRKVVSARACKTPELCVNRSRCTNYVVLYRFRSVKTHYKFVDIAMRSWHSTALGEEPCEAGPWVSIV